MFGLPEHATSLVEAGQPLCNGGLYPLADGGRRAAPCVSIRREGGRVLGTDEMGALRVCTYIHNYPARWRSLDCFPRNWLAGATTHRIGRRARRVGRHPPSAGKVQ